MIPGCGDVVIISPHHFLSAVTVAEKKMKKISKKFGYVKKIYYLCSEKKK